MKYGLLKGLATARQINPVTLPNLAVLEEIRVDWPNDTVKILLTKAVQKLNNRSTIALLQKARRNVEKAIALTAVVAQELAPEPTPEPAPVAAPVGVLIEYGF